MLSRTHALLAAMVLGGSPASVVGAGIQPSLDVPHARVAPRLDASPADPAWEHAAEISALGLSILPGGETRNVWPTRVRLLWDEDWLYVRFICRDDDVYSRFTRHDDPLYQADVVEVFLDPVGDGKQYIEIQVSPDNVTLDKLFVLTSEACSDEHGKLLAEVLERDFWEFLDWTLPGLRTAARRVPAPAPEPGWLVDIALPAGSILRRTGKHQFEPQTLRANLLRYDWQTAPENAGARSLVAMNWAPVMDGCPHLSPRAMGALNLVAR